MIVFTFAIFHPVRLSSCHFLPTIPGPNLFLLLIKSHLENKDGIVLPAETFSSVSHCMFSYTTWHTRTTWPDSVFTCGVKQINHIKSIVYVTYKLAISLTAHVNLTYTNTHILINVIKLISLFAI